MNVNQVAVLKSALYRFAIVCIAVIVVFIIIDVTAYYTIAKTDVAVSSIAVNQLTDGGETYQQIKTMSQGFYKINSIFYWIKLFVALSGIGYIVYLVSSSYKRIMELGSKKE